MSKLKNFFHLMKNKFGEPETYGRSVYSLVTLKDFRRSIFY